MHIPVLHHAAQKPIDGVAMLEELARYGDELSPGARSPLLPSLEAEGYVARTERTVEGRMRKYAAITSEGRAAFQEAKHKIAELVREDD